MESKNELMKRLKEVGEKIENYDPEDHEVILNNSKFCEYFEEMIDEDYSSVHILDLEFFASDILKKALSKNEYHYIVQSFLPELEIEKLKEFFESYKQLLEEKERITWTLENADLLEVFENENDN